MVISSDPRDVADAGIEQGDPDVDGDVHRKDRHGGEQHGGLQHGEVRCKIASIMSLPMPGHPKIVSTMTGAVDQRDRQVTGDGQHRRRGVRSAWW